MIKGIGIDIIEISRIKKAVLKERFLNKVYTEYELQTYQRRNFNISYLAGVFCAKEAYVKALGTGFRGISFKDIEIRNDELGKPYYNVEYGDKLHLSISHSRLNAIATCIIEE